MQFGLSILEQQAPSSLHPLLEDVREEVGQMSALLDEILQFTKAGLQNETHFEEVHLGSLVQKALEQESIPQPKVQVSIPSDLTVRVDPHLLQRAIANVLRNSIRYAADSGPIQIEARIT